MDTTKTQPPSGHKGGVTEGLDSTPEVWSGGRKKRPLASASPLEIWGSVLDRRHLVSTLCLRSYVCKFGSILCGVASVHQQRDVVGR